MYSWYYSSGRNLDLKLDFLTARNEASHRSDLVFTGKNFVQNKGKHWRSNHYTVKKCGWLDVVLSAHSLKESWSFATDFCGKQTKLKLLCCLLSLQPSTCFSLQLHVPFQFHITAWGLLETMTNDEWTAHRRATCQACSAQTRTSRKTMLRTISTERSKGKTELICSVVTV